MDINMDYPPTNLNYIHHLPEFNWLELREQSFTAFDWDIVELYIGHEVLDATVSTNPNFWLCLSCDG